MKNKEKNQIPHNFKTECQEISPLLKALAHPGRLLIMGHLVQGKKTVSELQELSGISQSLLSQFLSRMRLEGLVACEKQGRFQFYFPADDRIKKLVRVIQSLYCHQ